MTTPTPPTKQGRPIPGYHSEEPYTISPEDSSAIVRASAYHREDYDLAVICFPDRTHVDIDITNSSPNHNPATTLGDLDKLPLELIHEICLHSDMSSIFRFRQVNTRARHILYALYEYRVVTTHARDAFCAMLRTELDPCPTLSAFYQLLSSQKCSICGHEYGDLIHLPTCIRCCSFCVRKHAPELRVATAAKAIRYLKLSRHALSQITQLKLLPGIYGMEERRRVGRPKVLSIQSAREAYRKQNGGEEPTNMMMRYLQMQPILAFMVCCALPSYSLPGRVENGICCIGCQAAIEKGILIHTGNWAFHMRDLVYSVNGFLKHFVWCEQAQLLWLESNRGSCEPPNWPYICIRGGFFTRRK
ncbi:hypothetical protein BU24DRAFT_421144 [Aaosphaeria arxii CBS 175.79]|uniref:F-box domain-containing protein n=1 Tax=Aaosphaeria arxii CBS 175.79 TaxID=1450172 RepID=A0A6A5XY99_9PLEO|nr:uncharacterized protein BU24DRAFT_421144 [Aaosphaeria arxii CBS 175.79]KAF2018142.1 hypothetical protein BU24DRAFT_421144 [Aaosphaeria arxii CBS 175.79]